MSRDGWSSNLGIYFYGFGSFAAGVCDLIWRDFDSAHQPIQAWGDTLPGVTIFACIVGVWLVVGSVALLWRRSERAGAAALAWVYFLFAIFWLPRLYTAPHYLGQRVPVYIGVLSGVGIELIAFAAGVLLWVSLGTVDLSRSRVVTAMRWVFGLCTVDFGLQHLTNIPQNLQYVPKWLPPGAEFWVIVTGTCFVLAGLAILTGIKDVLASWLLGLMFLAFNLTILPTYIFVNVHEHAAWGGNAYNLAAVGSAWIMAAVLGKKRAAVSR